MVLGLAGVDSVFANGGETFKVLCPPRARCGFCPPLSPVDLLRADLGTPAQEAEIQSVAYV